MINLNEKFDRVFKTKNTNTIFLYDKSNNYKLFRITSKSVSDGSTLIHNNTIYKVTKVMGDTSFKADEIRRLDEPIKAVQDYINRNLNTVIANQKKLIKKI